MRKIRHKTITAKPNVFPYRRFIFRAACILLIIILWLVSRSWSDVNHGSVGVTKEATSTAALNHEKEYKTVLYVLDGDTIVLTDGTTVRYIGIDTPEIKHKEGVQTDECFGREAMAENRALVEDKQVTMLRDVSQTDTYGRLLRYVYVGDTFVNDVLVKNGFATVSTFPPDTLHSGVFTASQAEAKSNKRGLWSVCRE